MGETVNELALFAGAGGGILGGKLLGWRTVCAVEIDDYARRVLVARQDDGCLEPFPIFADVTKFDGRPWRGVVDVVSGGFPCQDISAAGKGAGIDGKRSGLWREMARIIREVGPRYVLVENSPMLTLRGLGCVLGDLAEMGYDARWGVLGACDAGAPHRRERIWIIAHTERILRQQAVAEMESGEPIGTQSGDAGTAEYLAHSDGIGREGVIPGESDSEGWQDAGERQARPSNDGGTWWKAEPDVGGKAHGMAEKLDGHETHE